MAEIFIAVVAKLSEYTVKPVVRQFDYQINYKSKIQDLYVKIITLTDKSDGVRHRVDQAIRKLESILPEVQIWLERVDRTLVEMEECFEERRVAKATTCCSSNGWSPNLKVRHSLSRKATKMLPKVDQLIIDGNFPTISYPLSPPKVEFAMQYLEDSTEAAAKPQEGASSSSRTSNPAKPLAPMDLSVPLQYRLPYTKDLLIAPQDGTRERVKDANLEQKHRQVADEHEILPQHLKRLFLYCSLFPFDYEFRKDELVQLWIAGGFIRERQTERMEDIASEHFNSLEKEGFFVFSRCDFTTDFDSVLSAPADDPSNFLYKVNPSKHSLLEETISSGDYFKAMDGKLDGASKMSTRHLSLIGGMDFGIVQDFKHLRTLHMLSCRGSSIKHVPRDFCFTLTFLRTLNLSGTLISELPSSIGIMKSLQYIDASHTPITRLPESIDSLHNLQTIKLRGCTHFVQLPKGMKKLSNLRHIDLDIIQQLDSMPGHLGNLTNLQTLPAFLVGRDDGCHVGELKKLNDLKGSFNISRLENVFSKEEAVEAALIDKKCIRRLELRWSDMFVDYAQQKNILECLRPHSGLKELQVQQYSGSILPTWISDPSFTDLVVITLYRCRNCKLLPCMGQLPALKSLSIIEVNEVKEINHQFLRNVPVDHAFPKLERLEIDIMLSLKEWKDVQMSDLPSLVKLTMDSCPELDTIPPISCLKSLKHLEFRRCPKLLSLPTDGLPTSLESFVIVDCHELKDWCLNTEHWSMLCHVPSVWFDNEQGFEHKLREGETDADRDTDEGIREIDYTPYVM